jgi:hypothetical protein
MSECRHVIYRESSSNDARLAHQRVPRRSHSNPSNVYDRIRRRELVHPSAAAPTSAKRLGFSGAHRIASPRFRQTPVRFDLLVLANLPAQFLEALLEYYAACRASGLPRGIVKFAFNPGHQNRNRVERNSDVVAGSPQNGINGDVSVGTHGNLIFVFVRLY